MEADKVDRRNKGIGSMPGSILSRARLTLRPLFPAALIATVCLIAYSNSFHVPFQFDDVHNILEKPFVRDIGYFFDHAGRHWFSGDYGFRMRTVGYYTFALNYWLNGPDVIGYHIFNLFIHILNGLLLYRLVVLSFRTPALANTHLKGSSKKIALFAALLFVAHPVQTEAVTYIVQRLASLATFFYLLSFVAYVEWRLTRGLQRTGRSSQLTAWIFYALSIVAAAVAMKTKEIAFTLPVMIAFYEFLFMEGNVRRRAVYLIPLLLTMVIIPIELVNFKQPIGEVIGDMSKVTRVESAMPRSEYFATELRVIVTYVRLLFFPVNQNLDYNYQKFRSILEPQVLLSLLFLLSILCLGIYFLRLSRKKPYDSASVGLFPSYPVLRLAAFGIFWFFITLSVESSVIPIADVIFEHRVYLPSAGFFMTVVTAAFLIQERLRPAYRKIVIPVLSVILICLTLLTYLRNNVWRSEVSLWEDVVRKSPMNARSYNGLGLAYQREEKLNKAVEAYLAGLRIYPAYALAHNGLGSVYFQQGKFREAIEQFDAAIALEPGNHVFINNRGLSYAALGDFKMAEVDYKQAIALQPAYAEAYHNLAFAHYLQGHFEKAITLYDKAIALEPDVALYYSDRALTRISQGEYERAINDATKAITIDPRTPQAYNTRGMAEGMSGRYSQAISDFTTAFSLDPRRVDYLRNRALAYQLTNDMSMAIADFEKGCEMGDQESCKNLRQAKGRTQ
jgi:tetratricopeptide (TPR) repeat protein